MDRSMADIPRETSTDHAREFARRSGQPLVTPTQHAFGRLPRNARVSNGHTVTKLRQLLRNRLTPFVQITLDHRADQRPRPGGALFDNAAPDIFLFRRLFARVRVAA